MKRALTAVLLAVFVFAALFAFAQDRVPRITKEELRAMLGDPAFIILDVRLGQEWSSSDKQIQGAVREDPRDFASWMNKYPKDKTLVFYCS
jgi:rhodanese-related sulfurtransferase